MWVRRRLDIGWADIFWARWRCIVPLASTADARRRLESAWGGEDQAVACLSVRTGFDLLLRALALPPGSEVLMSALNVPGMFRIVQEHGLVPVPLDLDPNLSPSPQTVRAAITPKSRVIVVAHLFGARADLTPLHPIAQEHDLLLIEDRAQAFDGLPAGIPEGCDAALYSFGTIKTATAFGGAMLTIRDSALAEKVRGLEHALPTKSRLVYRARLAKYAAAKLLTGRRTFATLLRALAWAGVDADTWIQSTVTGFRTNGFLQAIRHQPCIANIALMERRIQDFDPTRAHHQRQRGLNLATSLGKHLPVAGDPTTHTFDLFPLRLGNPKTVQAALRKAGFDTTMRGSITTAPCPDPSTTVPGASRLLNEILFLPLYPAIPDTELDRMANTIRQCAKPPRKNVG